MNSSILFVTGLLLAGSGLVSPPVALVAGVVFGFTVEHPLRQESSTLAKWLLQASVVALGFDMNLRQVFEAGRSGFVYSATGIGVAMALGLGLGALLRIGGRASFLITAGTAICGGSAIAAIAPINGASEEEISIAMGTVFLLNSVALLIFPPIGAAFHLSQHQFGLWAALAIHDTSSVVGATAHYGKEALVVGTTVKLARALWIVPVSLLTAAWMAQIARGSRGGAAKIKLPWFIALFCGAAALSTYLPGLAAVWHGMQRLGRSGLVATLFLIGTGLSKQTLRKVGVRPLVQGVVLWVAMATVSLLAIYRHLISI